MKSKSFLTIIVRWLYPYGSIRQVLLGPVGGLKYVVERGHGFTYALGMGSFNFTFLSRHIRQGMVIYDVGANRGQMALFFARKSGPTWHVYSFEPAPIPFQSLQRNITINKLSNIHAQQCVVGRVDAEELFSYSDESPTQGALAALLPQPQDKLGSAQPFRVPCFSLDTLVQEHARQPELLKIDVEGSAAAVLEGARTTLRKFGPSIYIELHSADEQRAVRDELLPCGYLLETLQGRLIADPTAGWVSPLWCYRPR